MTRALVLALVLASAATAAADPLRLRGDALASSPSPAGLLVLQGGDDVHPWMSAEALVWLGAGDDAEADALTIAVFLHDPAGRASLRLGRQVLAVGALRPVHADGALALVRLPWRMTLEGFGGLPVVPRFGPRAYDWLVGGHVGQALGPVRLGVGWMQRRDHGALDTHELGADFQLVPDAPFDLSATAAWDLVDPALAEARLSAAYRVRAWRVELWASHLEPSHLLPATSLFSVLGDVASRRAGALVTWHAAPRLDLWLGGGATRTDSDTGVDASVRALLRLDDAGDGTLGLELRRDGSVDGGWSGVRVSGRVPLAAGWAVASELELVRPDRRDRGSLWPWALAALSWRPARAWEAALAVEASASPEDLHRVDVLARLGRSWELP